MTPENYPDRLSATKIALAFGVTRHAVAKWRCPKNEDGTFNLKSVILWRQQRAMEDAKLVDPEMLADSDNAERYRGIKADQEQIRLDMLRGETVRLDEFDTHLQRASDALLRGGDALRLRFGDEAMALYEQAVTEAREALQEPLHG